MEERQEKGLGRSFLSLLARLQVGKAMEERQISYLASFTVSGVDKGTAIQGGKKRGEIMDIRFLLLLVGGW
jgi:hypothetical protein